MGLEWAKKAGCQGSKDDAWLPGAEVCVHMLSQMPCLKQVQYPAQEVIEGKTCHSARVSIKKIWNHGGNYLGNWLSVRLY